MLQEIATLQEQSETELNFNSKIGSVNNQFNRLQSYRQILLLDIFLVHVIDLKRQIMHNVLGVYIT